MTTDSDTTKPSKFNPFNSPPLSPNLTRPPVHSIPLSHYQISKKPLKLQRHNTKYFIIPVTHNSVHSYSLVNKVCKVTNPDYIAVELSKLDDVTEAQRSAKEQALACQLGRFENRQLVFMDRPIEYTRQSQKHYWQHCRIRRVLHQLWNNEQVTPDDAEYFWFFMKYSAPYLMSYVVPMLGKNPAMEERLTQDGQSLSPGQMDYHAEFDRLLEVGIFDAHYTEREQYMVQKLWEIADANPKKDQVVMAVVGQLHVPHIKFFWDRNDLLSTDDLCSFVAPQTVLGNVMAWQVYWVCFVTVVLLARSWHYFRMPRLERPKWRAPLTWGGAAFWTGTQFLPAFTVQPAHATVGIISSALIYSSYTRLRKWGVGRASAMGMTAVPIFGYLGYKTWSAKRNLDRASRARVVRKTVQGDSSDQGEAAA